MATVYYGKIKDPNDDLYQLYIYTGTPVEIAVSPIGIIWNRDNSDDLFQPIRATSLTLELYATKENDLSEIWNQEDRYWKVLLKKNGAFYYRGYVSNENIQQSFVSETYPVTVEVLDALSYLEDKQYLDDDGLEFSGNATAIQVIARCLRRGEEDPTDTPYIHASLAFTMVDDSRFLDNAYLDQSVFYENDEPQSCKEVLESVLKSIGACVFQYLSTWYIMDIRQMFYNFIFVINFRVYTNQGGSFGTSTFAIPTPDQREIRSQNKGRPIYHANKNQYFINRSRLHSVRLQHKYQYKDQIIPNGELIAAGAGPYTMPSWTLTGGQAEAYVNGILVDGVVDYGDQVVAAVSTGVRMDKGATVKLTLTHEYVDDPKALYLKIFLDAIGGSDRTLYRSPPYNENVWTTSDYVYQVVKAGDNMEEGVFTHVIEFPPLPVDGTIIISYYNPIYEGNHTVNSKVNIQGVTAELINSNVEGLEHTGKRNDVTKGRTEDPEEILFTTTAVDVLKNVFYDSSGDPVVYFKFLYGGATFQGLEYLAQQRLDIQKNVELVYSGDVFGYVEYPCPKFMLNPANKYFLPTKISKDLQTGVSQCEMISGFVGQSFSVTHTERVIYKDSVKVKLV